MKLPPRVKPKHGRYYLLSQSTERGATGRLKRRWVPLSKVKDGPAALYDALANLHRERTETAMPAVVAAWKRDSLQGYALKTRVEYERMCGVIATAFDAFDVRDVEPKDVAELIDQWKDKPRAGNAYRSLLSLVMAYACRKGIGGMKVNPVREVSGFRKNPRSRYLTDAELSAIKAKASPMTAAMIDLALVTGQRIGDLLALKWSDVLEQGIVFRPAKVKDSTAVAVPIKMTPRLRAVLDRCKVATKVGSMWVIHTRQGQPLTYHGAHSAWVRACDAAKVADANIHDLKHRALTDAERQGKDARRLGGHSSKAMTQRYIEAAGLDWIDPPDEAML